MSHQPILQSFSSFSAHWTVTASGLSSCSLVMVLWTKFLSNGSLCPHSSSEMVLWTQLFSNGSLCPHSSSVMVLWLHGSSVMVLWSQFLSNVLEPHSSSVMVLSVHTYIGYTTGCSRLEADWSRGCCHMTVCHMTVCHTQAADLQPGGEPERDADTAQPGDYYEGRPSLFGQSLSTYTHRVRGAHTHTHEQTAATTHTHTLRSKVIDRNKKICSFLCTDP